MKRTDSSGTMSIFDALLEEIVRVSIKQYRWKETQGEIGTALTPAITMMQMDLDIAKNALSSLDPARIMAAKRALKGYSDHD